MDIYFPLRYRPVGSDQKTRLPHILTLPYPLLSKYIDIFVWSAYYKHHVLSQKLSADPAVAMAKAGRRLGPP